MFGRAPKNSLLPQRIASRLVDVEPTEHGRPWCMISTLKKWQRWNCQFQPCHSSQIKLKPHLWSDKYPNKLVGLEFGIQDVWKSAWRRAYPPKWLLL